MTLSQGNKMEFEGKLKSYGENHMTIYIPDGFDIKEIRKKANDGIVVVDFCEELNITVEQRTHFYALIGDYSEYTGVPVDAAEAFVKYNYMLKHDLGELPSLKRNAMTKSDASQLLEYTIDYFITNDIPFRKQAFYLTTDVSKMLYAMTMKRLCLVCGKPHSDIHHHSNLPGIGNNRKNHDHYNSTFLCLCRTCHEEVHHGFDIFLTKHHLKPVKLSKEDLFQLGLMTKKQM